MSGMAWRYELPSEMIGKMSINLLEFLAAAITIYLRVTESSTPQKPLALTDSSSALGWLYKASFPESMEGHDMVARWLALVLVKNESAIYSQHIKGKRNFIADSLSRDHHMTNDQLTYAFKTLLPLQTPSSFAILPLPREVDSIISSLNQRLITTQESHHHPTRSKLGASINGVDSWETLISTMSGCLDIVESRKHTYSLHLQALAEEISMVRRETRTYGATRSNPPYQMYG